MVCQIKRVSLMFHYKLAFFGFLEAMCKRTIFWCNSIDSCMLFTFKNSLVTLQVLTHKTSKHFKTDIYMTLTQAFRFMVVPCHCSMISKYGPSLSKAVGPVDPSFLVMKKSHFNKKNIHLTARLQTPQKRKCMKVVNTVKPVLSSHSKKDKTKILITNGSL